MTDNINKHIALNVCIEGVILYGDMEFNADGSPKNVDINPITHCRDLEDDGTHPSPVCTTTDCPRKCPFNDWEKEERILTENEDKITKCLQMIEKTIYG
jgi:hypothetical protein